MLGRLLRPRGISTSTAPAPAPGVDVTHAPRQPVLAAAASTPQRLDRGPGDVTAASPDPGNGSAAEVLPPRESWRGSAPRPPEMLTPRSPSTMPAHALCPPSWTPGTCYHVAHITLPDGFRYGVHPEPGDDPSRASLLRCSHNNPDGD